MGHLRFGNLAFIRNVIYVRISPYEQKAFPDYFKNALNGLRRDFNSVVPYAIGPFTAAYLIISWGNAENRRLNRKNPQDYENEV